VLIVLAAIAGVTAISSCADTRGGPIAYSETFSAPNAPTVVLLEANYRIAPLDIVTVKVFKMPDVSGDFEVDLTVQISMPLIGEVPVVDLTTAPPQQAEG
jgi:polysaccharide export outer membrane protein